MSATTKEVEKLVLSGREEYYGTPMSLWTLASTGVKTASAGNIKPTNIEVYEALDEQNIRIYSERKNSEYDSSPGSVKGYE